MSRRLIGALAAPAAALMLGAQPATANRPTSGASIVEVIAGKPSEFHFTFSRHKVPQGAVTFEVTNEGKLPHNFEIAGKKTKLLSPGESQRLVVRFAKAGRYPYMCTVSGHAVAGMRGTLQITAPALARTTSTTDIVTAGRPSELRFTLSKKTVARGAVAFKVTNKGSLPHDFEIRGKKTRLLAPGKPQTLKVVFPKAGRYLYLCTVPGHATAGMRGTLVVTGGRSESVANDEPKAGADGDEDRFDRRFGIDQPGHVHDFVRV
jgi:uncharacterized cupredoxin-like copper-binding protein